jgi:5'(3')-deoxyribonucleotidase
MNTTTIILDLDGVIVDFVRPVMSLHSVTYKGEQDYPVACGWDVVEACNVLRKKQWKNYLTDLSDREFWQRCGTETFWAGLQPYDGAADFISDLCDLVAPENIVISTNVVDYAGAPAGKVKWINQWMPKWKHRYLIGAPKWALSHPCSLLIDDNEDNVNNFLSPPDGRHGGKAVLVPRPWNFHRYCGTPYSLVLEQVKGML